MNITCDCGQQVWHKDLEPREIDSKKMHEVFELKAKMRKFAKVEKLELRVVYCSCGRRYYHLTDTDELYDQLPLVYEEVRRRVGIPEELEKEAGDYPLMTALNSISRGDTKTAAMQLKNLYEYIDSGGTFSDFQAVLEASLEYDKDQQHERELEAQFKAAYEAKFGPMPIETRHYQVALTEWKSEHCPSIATFIEEEVEPPEEEPEEPKEKKTCCNDDNCGC